LLTPEGWLQKGSPAINSGLPLDFLRDIHNEPRSANPDAGADEFTDTDDDGLPDLLDSQGVSGPIVDSDGDGLSNLQEQAMGTNPSSRDSDKDGVSDGDEALVNFTNPTTKIDGDGDGDTIPDDLEKHLSRQFLANQPDPAIWGTYMAGLEAGDLDATHDYTGDGISACELAAKLTPGAAVAPPVTGFLVEPQSRFNYIAAWAKITSYPPFEEIRVNYIAGGLENSSWFFGSVDDMSPAYLASRIDSVPWEPSSMSGSGLDVWPSVLRANDYFDPNHIRDHFRYTGYSNFGEWEYDAPMSGLTTRCQGGIKQTRFRVMATRADHDPLLENFLKLIVIRDNKMVPSPLKLSVEPLTIQIPKGEFFTKWFELNAPIVDGVSTDVILLPVEIMSDLNNDGKITAADNPLRDAAMASGATDEIKDKGTEFIFQNDTLSNGAWDREDTDPARPATAKDDDDAEEITIKPGITEGEVWLDHPAIAGLSFYKTRECNAADKVNLSPNSKFTVSASNPFPGKLFMRADGTLAYPEANPQFEGDLVLKIKVGTAGQEIEAVKMKLTVVKQLGAKKYFHAARDYIMENNARIFVRDKAYGSSTSFRVVSMLEESARMYPIDAARRTTGAAFKGIDQVNAAYDGSIHVVVNGNMNFFSDDRFNGTVGNVAAALQGLITDKCHGRLVRMNSYDAAVSSDNTSSTSSPQGSDLAGDTYGRYIAQYNQDNKYSLAAGRVPLPSPSGGPSAAMGGLSTNYSNADRVNREYQLIGYSKCTDPNKGIVFTATQLTGTGSGPSLADDAKKSGVAALPGGDADDLQILLLDGGTSTAMSHAKPDGSLSTRVKKGKHTGTLYYINTYLLFYCEKPRP
jgi:hypothetical protein